MNRITTNQIVDPNVEQGFTGPSLDFLQNAVKFITSALAQSINGSVEVANSGYILYGCKKTDLGAGNFSFTTGYIYLTAFNEVFYVPALASTAFPDVPVLTLTILNDPTADPSPFSDGTPRNVHNIRRMVISNGVSGSGDFDYNDLSPRSEDWQTGLFSSNVDGILYRKDKEGFVEIYGVLSYATGRTLPSGYRPSSALTFASGVAIANSGTPSTGPIQINIATSGVITTTPSLSVVGSGNYANVFVSLKFKID